MERIIPSPTQVLRELMNGEKYYIYVAFEGRVPRNEDKHSNYVCPTEQVFHVTASTLHKHKKCQDICKSVCTTTEEWLFDTGATVHVTPYKNLRFNTSISYREIQVANGKHVLLQLVQLWQPAICYYLWVIRKNSLGQSCRSPLSM
jgi:hypothetical protein